MAVSDEFVDYVVDQLSGWGEVSVRRMFGGQAMGQICRGFGVSEATYYRWQKSYGSRPAGHVRWLS